MNRDITAVLNLHREGLIARATLESYSNSIKKAREFGLNCEIMVVLDCADQPTRDLVDLYPLLRESVYDWEVDDLGEARNQAAKVAQGTWITYLDGDDLWTPDWIIKAYSQAIKDPRRTIWHPEFNVYFGDEPMIVCHSDMEDRNFDCSKLALVNCWTALCFTSRETVLSIPYRKTESKNKFGYEDWTWNIETSLSGIFHKVVPDTTHGIRLRRGSMSDRLKLKGFRPYFPRGIIDFIK